MSAVLLLLPMLAEAQLALLTVKVDGLEPATGAVEVSLFNSADSFMKTPFLQQSKPVDGNEDIAIEFAGLLDGDYAIVVVHDENDNGVLDTGFLGLGGESYGYSNNASTWLGRPKFEAARFTIGVDDLEMAINLD